MIQAYKTIYEGGEGEISEKKSRFIAHTAHVENEEEAMAFIEKIKKSYWDARHNCWAYSVGTKQPNLRCSDDGEPSGTAGKPMLEVIQGVIISDNDVQVNKVPEGEMQFYKEKKSMKTRQLKGKNRFLSFL